MELWDFVFINTRSLLLCFHPKPSFVMHDGNVILSPCRFVSNFLIVLNFLIAFSIHVVLL